MVDTVLLAMVANPLDGLSDEMDELLDGFMSKPLVGSSGLGLTNYIFWMCVALALLLIVIFAFKGRQTKGLVPEGVFVNAMESVVEFVRDDMCKSILGDRRGTFPSSLRSSSSSWQTVSWASSLGRTPERVPSVLRVPSRSARSFILS